MKYFFCILMILCYACQEKGSSRVHELCNKLENKPDKTVLNVDSVISRAQKIGPVERYATICRGARISNELGQYGVVARYLKELSTLPFPEVKNKEDGFFLMRQYAYGGLGVETVDIKAFSSLLFDMENRFDLTPGERYDFLTLKAGIYIHLFQEYESGAFIVAEAIDFGSKSEIAGKKLLPTFSMLFRCSMYMQDPSKSIKMALHLLDSINSQLDDATKQLIYDQLSVLYYQQKEYEKAYVCLMKSKINKTWPYSDMFIDILLKTKRMPELMDCLNANATWAHEQFKEKMDALHVSLGKIAWEKANAYLLKGDTSKYEHYLREAIDYYDLEPLATGVVVGEISETYARLLWKRGKRDEAIRRMESFSEKKAKHGSFSYENLNFNDIEKILARVHLMSDYYSQVGRATDAFRQLQLYDSLKTGHTNILLREEKRKYANCIYINDLRENLDLRTIQYKQERQKGLFSFILFVLAMIMTFIFGRLYYRRQGELNNIYARQRKMEQMEVLFTKIEAVENSDELSADKQLYLRLQKQMYEEKLFLRPDFSRDDLCRLVGSNRMYVSTCINKYAEMNLNQWINKARVNHAIQVIHAGETNLQELAQVSGFSSISTFYRSFKYFTLLSPKQYIERMAQ